MLKIAIGGVGALACLFGAKLSPHADVTLIGRWPAQIATLRRAGLRIITFDGEQRVPLRATDRVATVGVVDAALILTKAPKTQQAADDVAQILKPDGIAVTLQNGIGNLDVLAAAVGAERAALGVTTWGAALDAPGVLRLGGVGTVHLATRPAIDPAVRALADLLTQAGLGVEVVDDVSGLAWGKLAINAAINPLTALLRVPNGRLLDSVWARDLMEAAAREVEAVAAAQGIALPYEDAAAQALAVAQQTALNRSSMLQDVTRGTLTEIDVICGAVVRAGEATDVPTPVNRLLMQLIKAVEELYEAG